VFCSYDSVLCPPIHDARTTGAKAEICSATL
jgi:hypothetical protein